MNESEEKYITKINYPHLIFIQIQRVMDAIDAGGDGLEELKNLKVLLKRTWRLEIDAMMEKQEQEMRRKVRRMMRMRNKLGMETYAKLRREAIVEYVREYIQCVIDKMDEVGLLLVEEQSVLKGGGIV